jgi:hypothetical protein
LPIDVGSPDIEQVEAVAPAPVGEQPKVAGVVVAGRRAVAGEEAGNDE